uniref:Major facilitator superfamily (MFS) profile domain-containing protein n=1 Tax=Lygus hesperus TaxID=30085 RepID=A0A0K8SM70_LYGHE
MSLFTSPWSETNGRKPVLIVSLTGQALTQAAFTYMSTIKKINPYWYLVAGIPASISGGPILTILSCYCYLIDVTCPKDRVIRLAVLNEFVCIIAVIANLVAPTLQNMGYLAVYGTGAVLMVIVLLYVIILLPESAEVMKETSTTLFTTDHLIDSFKTFFKRRPGNTRSVIFALTGCGVVSLLVNAGEPDCKYLATMKKFDWGISDYTTFNAVSLIVQALGTLSGVYLLMNICRLGEAASNLVIQISLLASSILTAIATTPTMFYITSQIRIFYGCLGPITKGFISKLLPPHDIAKVLAFGSTLEAFMPQIGAVLYANLYNRTVGTDPFAIFLLSASLQLLVIIWTIIGFTRFYYGKGKTDIDQEIGNIKDEQ